MPHGGLALANSLATGLEMVILLIVMRRRLNGLHGKVILDAVWKGVVACVIMAMGLSIWLAWSGSDQSGLSHWVVWQSERHLWSCSCDSQNKRN